VDGLAELSQTCYSYTISLKHVIPAQKRLCTRHQLQQIIDKILPFIKNKGTPLLQISCPSTLRN